MCKNLLKISQKIARTVKPNITVRAMSIGAINPLRDPPTVRGYNLCPVDTQVPTAFLVSVCLPYIFCRFREYFDEIA
ncbi:hypothetical protein E4653_01245 [Corynebacterium diphtheriae subsp. lausannense]|nr:hypothetical protein E4653_01245 [Corynebacterium diphtheriae subsp. lausannense]